VADAFVEEFSPLVDGIFELLVESGGRASRRDVMVCAAMIDQWADDRVVPFAAAVRMFFASLDKEAHEKDEFGVTDALNLAKRIIEVTVHSLKGVGGVLLSFDIAYTNFLAEQIDEFFVSLDTDDDCSLSIGELMEPIRKVRAYAAEKHQEVMLRDASEVSRVGQIYQGLIGMLEDETSEYSAYEAEAQLFDLAMAPPDDPKSWTSGQMWYKLGLLKDALLGRLAIKVRHVAV
jgi:hypothetical protein